MGKMKFTDCIELVGSACPSYKGEKNYISTGAIAIDKIDADKVEVVSYKDKPSRANLVVDKNTIIFAKMQATKKTLLINEESEKNIYSTGFCAVKPKETIINSRCLYHLLMSKMFLEQKDKNCSGATQKAITNAGLDKIYVTVPPLEMQTSIAEQLDKILSIINIRQLELSYLDNLIKARFVELFGNPDINEQKWEICKLEALCDVGSSKRIYQSEQSLTGIPFLRISDLVNRMDNGSLESDLFIPEIRYEELKEQGLVPQSGDILLTARGTLGRCYIVKEDDEFYFQDGMITWLSHYDSRVTPLYISYLFEMPGFRKQIDALQAGSTVAYLSIAMAKKLDVMVPSIYAQNQFADFVKQVDKSKVVFQL